MSITYFLAFDYRLIQYLQLDWHVDQEVASSRTK